MSTRTIAEPVPERPQTPGWLAEVSKLAAGVSFGDLPGEVVARTKLVVLDSIGAMAAGAQEPEMVRLAGRRVSRAPGRARVIGRGVNASAEAAAFLNGTAGTMLELDEGNQFARGHPGIHVVPAVLAAASERGVSGAEAITAIAVGYEIGARIGIASKLRVTMHPHGTWGTVGAAVAVALLNRANGEEMRETINVASCLGLATSRRTMLEGGTVRNSYAGFSNQLGLTAWDLVASGFSGEADGLGTIYGTVIAEDWRPEAMVEGLGERWEIARNYFKRHACCRYNHGALDALLRLMAENGGGISAETVDRIDVASYVWAAQLAGQEPHNMLAAKFSLPFSVATTIVHGAATIEAFREGARGDERVRALARRVFVREDAAMTAQLPALRPARVRITLKDGRVLTGEATTNRGDAEDPYSAGEVAAKFMETAGPVYGADGAERIREAIERLDSARSLDEATGLM